MSLYEPPRVRVADAPGGPPSGAHRLAALGVPWLLCVGAQFFVSPALAEALAASLQDPLAQTASVSGSTLALVSDLILDTLFAAVATWWALLLSRLGALPVALLFGATLFAVRVLYTGGLPGVIETGLPGWYDVLGNLNDLAGALAAAAWMSFTQAGREDT